MGSTLLLDRTTNDLCLNAAGGIAVATDPYATNQAVACALKLKQGEDWYDTTVGVPYNQILGNAPPLQWIKMQFEEAALSVPGVLSAVCYISSFTNRNLVGQVQWSTSTTSGTTSL